MEKNKNLDKLWCHWIQKNKSLSLLYSSLTIRGSKQKKKWQHYKESCLSILGMMLRKQFSVKIRFWKKKTLVFLRTLFCWCPTRVCIQMLLLLFSLLSTIITEAIKKFQIFFFAEWLCWCPPVVCTKCPLAFSHLSQKMLHKLYARRLCFFFAIFLKVYEIRK